MITIGTLPILLKTASKLDFAPMMSRLKQIDGSSSEKMKKSDLMMLGAEMISLILPQLGKIADDIPEIAAAYRGISLEEARGIDAADLVNEMIHDEGIRTFFERAFRAKGGQDS